MILSPCVHADTYVEFVRSNEELLKKLPPPAVAVSYYKSGDLYLVSISLNLLKCWNAALIQS